MKIYTKRGDQGETDLLGGGRVSKDCARVEAYGAVDELNACLGRCAAESTHDDLCEIIRDIQSSLFDLGVTWLLRTPGVEKKASIPQPEDSDVERLEARIDALEGELEPLKRFILPGGTPRRQALHLARTVCRRAERRENRSPRGGTGERSSPPVSKPPVRSALRNGACRESTGGCR